MQELCLNSKEAISALQKICYPFWHLSKFKGPPYNENSLFKFKIFKLFVEIKSEHNKEEDEYRGKKTAEVIQRHTSTFFHNKNGFF